MIALSCKYLRAHYIAAHPHFARCPNSI